MQTRAMIPGSYAKMIPKSFYLNFGSEEFVLVRCQPHFVEDSFNSRIDHRYWRYRKSSKDAKSRGRHDPEHQNDRRRKLRGTACLTDANDLALTILS